MSGEAPTTIRRQARSPARFVGALNDYLFRDLGYKTPLTYRPNNYAGIGNDWDFTAQGGRTGSSSIADTSVDLADAMRENPRMKILSVNGLLRPRDAVPRRGI